MYTSCYLTFFIVAFIKIGLEYYINYCIKNKYCDGKNSSFSHCFTTKLDYLQ